MHSWNFQWDVYYPFRWPPPDASTKGGWAYRSPWDHTLPGQGTWDQTGRDIIPSLDRQTPVKTLPSRSFAGSNYLIGFEQNRMYTN